MKKLIVIFLCVAIFVPQISLAQDIKDDLRPGRFSFFFNQKIEQISLFFKARHEAREEKRLEKFLGDEKPFEVTWDTPAKEDEKPEIVASPITVSEEFQGTKPMSVEDQLRILYAREEARIATEKPASLKPIPVYETKPTISVYVKPEPVKPTEPAETSLYVDKTMQIMYWWGKVNRHLEGSEWVTDPDGVSGANLDMLTYCKKWYPNSAAVKENVLVTIDGWHDRGNVGEYTTTKMSYYCLQKK